MVLLDSYMKEVEAGNVRAVEHPTLPYVLFKYTPECVYRKKWNETSLNARGHIVNKSTGLLVANPFPKFFNHFEEETELVVGGEKLEDFEYATKKEDGSLVFSYPTPDGIKWATTGSFTSEQAEKAQQLWDEVYAPNNPEAVAALSYLTLVAEVIYPENRIIVDYGREEKLVLLAVRPAQGGEELPYEEAAEFAEFFGMELVERLVGFTYNSFMKAREKASYNTEGWILHYKNGARVKVKTEDYVDAHKKVFGLGPSSFSKLWLRGESEKRLKEIPEEFREEFEEQQEKLDRELEKILEKSELIYKEEFSHIESKKERALLIRTYPNPYRSILFNISSGLPKERALRQAKEFVVQDLGRKME